MRRSVLATQSSQRSTSGRGRAVISWNSLLVLWATYYFCVFSIGRIERLTQPVIWLGGGILALVTVSKIRWRAPGVPTEVWLIGGFLGWALVGVFQVVDMGSFYSYFKLTVETLVVVALLGSVVRKCGTAVPIWWAFVGAAVYNTAALVVEGPISIRSMYSAVNRPTGLTDNANGLAFLCFMGVLGALALVGENLSLRLKLVAGAGAVIGFLGMLAASSRGAYASFVVAAFLWPLMCSEGRLRSAKAKLVTSALAAVILFGLIGWIQSNTTVGKRMASAVAREDHSTTERMYLVRRGYQIALDHPLNGVGLGQFVVSAGEGLYAHNEWIELAATTGFVGFSLYMSVYLCVWRRLSNSIRRTGEPVGRYRVNFARLVLIVLVLAGATFRPNFISVDAMFLLATVAGISWWARDQGVAFRRRQQRWLVDSPFPQAQGQPSFQVLGFARQDSRRPKGCR